ncbi:hypothetical protein BDQ12DRAFT_479198 [Crucibulum laeve]|uniref:Uncharacterized protein n=1 Tax=Crucibulum laeve TaxID=68775 RepID=A0A5C3LK79_9AGAR|nr:hypothetical protein BDQ12DRAFT_479198 [Crucibulum laeve]
MLLLPATATFSLVSAFCAFMSLGVRGHGWLLSRYSLHIFTLNIGSSFSSTSMPNLKRISRTLWLVDIGISFRDSGKETSMASAVLAAYRRSVSGYVFATFVCRTSEDNEVRRLCNSGYTSPFVQAPMHLYSRRMPSFHVLVFASWVLTHGVRSARRVLLKPQQSLQLNSF